MSLPLAPDQNLASPPPPPAPLPLPAPATHRFSRGEATLLATVGVFALTGISALLEAAVTGRLQVTPQVRDLLAVLGPSLTGLLAYLIASLKSAESR